MVGKDLGNRGRAVVDDTLWMVTWYWVEMWQVVMWLMVIQWMVFNVLARPVEKD